MPAEEITVLQERHPGAELQTDKPVGKVVPCIECGERELIVNQFYAPAIARCASCKGESAGAGVATVAAPVPGKTDPAKAADLNKLLVNGEFAHALCPVHPNDPDHEMELKWVSHSDHYGPSELVGYKNGRPEYRQTNVGETVLHQCLKCKATVSYSTTTQTQLRRVNEPREDKHAGQGLERWVGSRDEEAA
jgi:hypothetical protein